MLIDNILFNKCPHDKQCPLAAKDICRFIQRIDRHSVPHRCMFKSDRKRTKSMQANKKIVRSAHEIQFPYSYVILGKGLSPRLVSAESNHFPHYFMNEKQAEHAAYFWPRILTPPKVKHGHTFLNLCLPNRPAHASIDIDDNQLSTIMREDVEIQASCGRVFSGVKLNNKLSSIVHHNIVCLSSFFFCANNSRAHFFDHVFEHNIQ